MTRASHLVLPIIVCLVPQACLAQAPEGAAEPQADQAQQQDLRMVVPAEIYAVPGVEMNLYFDNILLHPASELLLYDVDCTLGAQQRERWTSVPRADQVGEHPLTLRVLTPEMRVIDQAQTTVRVTDPAAGAGEQITILCVGDSLTAASLYTRRLVALFAEDEAVDATLIGENGPTEEPGNRHEGYGGWTCQRFATTWAETDWGEVDGVRRRQRSPFVFEVEGQPRLDFQQYLERNNQGQPPDFITILLGCNDTFSATEANIESAIDTMFGHLDALLAALREGAPEADIGLLLLVPPAANQDAFASSYGCGQTRWQYRRNQHRVMEREMASYGGREDEGLFLVPAFVNLDAVHGFPHRSIPANAHTDVEISRLANGVHPNAAGYYQIGDAIYCWL
ncbi:MAG: SGNH/GDSL hydrolase family protein, partial [Armatimonadota bacterium]|nr:SGNH/GDSL hydrolase family protein [Armatimonadota bacterium]